MKVDEEAAAVRSLGARTTDPSPSAGNRFPLVEELLNVKSVSDPPSPNVKDAPSEHSGAEERLAQLQSEKEVLLSSGRCDQADDAEACRAHPQKKANRRQFVS